MSIVSFTLDPVAPFRLDFSVWTLRRRPENAVDRWDGERYQRTLTVAECTIEVTVTQVTRQNTHGCTSRALAFDSSPGWRSPFGPLWSACSASR